MWDALNRNAGGVQALAAVLSLAVTILLAAITWRYVVLTKVLADAAHAQLKLADEAARARRRELRSQIKLLNMILSTLPTERQQADRDMRQATSWDDRDLDRFQMLAAELGEIPGQHAALAVGAMKWLLERVEQVKATPLAVGVDSSDFPWERWIEEVTRALDRIRDVSDALKTMEGPRRAV